MNLQKLKEITKTVRREIVTMSHRSKVGHLASALSIVDIIVVLYFDVMKVFPTNPKHHLRDRFILSKGHAASAVYAILAMKRFFPKEWLLKYCQDGGKLGTHPDHYNVPGIEWTTGSLGHGLSIGCGMALALKMAKSKSRVFVLISDAESQEGEVWEAALTAAHHKLDNLVVIVDYNKVQAFGKVKEILNLEPFKNKWVSFGWSVRILNGHDLKILTKTLNQTRKGNKPFVIIAHTIRGKGIPFMHHKMEWYYHYPKEAEFTKALAHLD